jgi:hypothetical protein
MMMWKDRVTRARRFSLVVAAAIAMAALSLPAQAVDNVPYDQLPEPVLATARPLVANGQLGVVTREPERDDRGRVVYRILFTDGGGARHVLLIAEDGTLIARWFL